MVGEKLHILVLCTGNSARSQMAEGLLAHRYGDRVDVRSAGNKPAGYVHPLAVQVMDELGIDISVHWSKPIERYLNHTFEIVMTTCDEADESCPVFPGDGRRLHRDFPDPAKADGTESEVLEVFRIVRDDIAAWIDEIMSEY